MTDEIHHIPTWSGRWLIVSVVAAYVILAIYLGST